MSVTTVATIFACGGDDGGNGNNSMIDAAIVVDSTVFMDAPAGKMGLGTICSMAMPCAGSDAPLCLGTGSGAPMFCTAICGMTAGSNMPPTGGDALCQEFDSTGTPACVFYLPPSGSNTMYTWECGILCGTAGSADLGTCPSGLTCQSNVCR